GAYPSGPQPGVRQEPVSPCVSIVALSQTCFPVLSRLPRWYITLPCIARGYVRGYTRRWGIRLSRSDRGTAKRQVSARGADHADRSLRFRVPGHSNLRLSGRFRGSCNLLPL